MIFFFFNDTATTEIYTLSLHDALPISTKDIQAGRTEDFVAFFDTAGISEGEYDVKIILNYNGKTSERETTAKITNNSLIVFGFGGEVKERGWLMILVVVLIVLIIGNIAWFIFLRKKFMKKR